MPRSRRGSVAKQARKTIFKIAKGFHGAHSKLFRTVNQQVMKALQYSYSDRRKKKTQYRSIWIIRINAAARNIKTKYNKIINLLKRVRNIINRKTFSEIQKKNKPAFSTIAYHDQKKY